MAFRIEKRTLGCLAAFLLAPAIFAQQSFQYQARRMHVPLKSGDLGTLTIDPAGISFAPRRVHWDYQDIRQLKISAQSLDLLPYHGRTYHFDLAADTTFANAYQFLKTRLDQRFVAAIADKPTALLWRIPVRHAGDEGVLEVGAAEIIYRTTKKGRSRTWRYQDVDNISSSGPFDLTITTFERDKFDYGSRKQFSFALKQPLEEQRYNDLWLRLNQSKGLRILTSQRLESNKGAVSDDR